MQKESCWKTDNIWQDAWGNVAMNKWKYTLIISLLLLLSVLALGHAGAEGQSDAYRVGDVVDLQIADETDVTCIYTVFLNGQKIYQSKEADTHLKVSYRPREAGNYEIRADLTYQNGETRQLTAAFAVEPGPEQTGGPYSQRDGWWKDKAYRNSNLDAAGCAIFTLSHALHRMGIEGEDSEPAPLAVKYALCLVKGGTSNVWLIREAAEQFTFQTQADLLNSKSEIIREFRDGAMFSFSIVLGHIALAADLTDDGKMVEIVDSAPGVTLERIKKANMYYRNEKGEYVAFTDLSQVPGARYYLETQQWGGLTYYLDLDYVVRRGVRLIKPYWLRLEENGESLPADLVQFGSVQSTITVNKKERLVPTSSLVWRSSTQTPMAACVSGTKAVNLTDSAGKKSKSIPARTVLPVLGILEDQVQVRYDDIVGYVAKKNVEVFELSDVTGTPGVLSLNGKTGGKAQIRVRYKDGGKLMDNIRIGTPVVVLSETKESYEVEVDGRRGYVQKEFVTLEGELDNTDDEM